MFALARHERSELYATVSESWSQHKAHRALKVPNSVVYSYLTDLYRNGSAESLWAGLIAKAEYATLLLGAFLQTVQYDPVICFSHGKMMGVWARRGSLWRVTLVLVGQLVLLRNIRYFQGHGCSFDIGALDK